MIPRFLRQIIAIFGLMYRWGQLETSNVNCVVLAGLTNEVEYVNFGSCALNISEFYCADGLDNNHHIGFVGVSRGRLSKTLPHIMTTVVPS